MKKLSIGQWVAVAAAVAVVLWFFFGNGTMVPFFSSNNNNSNDNMMMNSQQNDGLVIQDVVLGTGAEAMVGKLVTTQYTGTFMDGRVFDTSVGRAPFTFPLGQGAVIKGWDKGIDGMKVGGKRRLTIPPTLGYGAIDMKDGAGRIIIPANSTLVFEVELLDVK